MNLAAHIHNLDAEAKAEALGQVEELCRMIWPGSVERISTEALDNSLDIYVRKTKGLLYPTEAGKESMVADIEQAAQVLGMGFARFWLNFADGTEQYCHRDGGEVHVGTRTSPAPYDHIYSYSTTERRSD